MNSTEKTYVTAYCDVIRCVSGVNTFITGTHRAQLDALETQLGETRYEELRQAARRRMGTA